MSLEQCVSFLGLHPCLQAFLPYQDVVYQAWRWSLCAFSLLHERLGKPLVLHELGVLLLSCSCSQC